jgi:hypothetical protein
MISPIRKRRALWFVASVILVGCLVWIMFVSYLRPRMVLTDRIHRAGTIGLACKLYATDHGGSYPTRLRDIVPKYLPDERYLRIPSSDGSGFLNYEYSGGRDTDPPDKVLIRILPEPPDNRSVVVHSDMRHGLERIYAHH